MDVVGVGEHRAPHIRKRFDALADYLAAARVVLVTSFRDPDGCTEPHRLPAEARRRSSGTLIAFDPGHAWSYDPPPAALALAELCDVLLVNGDEHRDLLPRLTRKPPAGVTRTTNLNIRDLSVHILEDGGLPRDPHATLSSCLALESPW